MAYKFQLGTAKLSGSIQLTDGSIDGTDVDDTTAANVVAQIDAGEIPIAKLAESDVSYGGVVLALGGVDATPAFDLSDATAYRTSALVGTITNAQLSGAIANAKLVNDSVDFGGVELSLGGVDATPAFNLSDATDYPTTSLVGTITNTQLSGAIANAKLVNDSVSYGGVELALGGVNATPAFDLSAASAYVGDSSLVTVGALNAGSITSGFTSIDVGAGAITTTGTGSFGKMVVSGDLSVAGDLTYIDTQNLRVSDVKVVFADGAAALAAGQGFYIGSDAGDATQKASFAVGDGVGTNDAFISTLNLVAPNFITDGSIATDEWVISDTHISGNLPVSASAFYGDGSNLSGVSADNASELDFNFSTLSAAGNVVARFTKVDSTSAPFTATMPAIVAGNDGAMFVIKDNVGQCATNSVTISANGTQKIENVDQDIILESGFAAVTMVASYNGGTNSGWMII